MNKFLKYWLCILLSIISISFLLNIIYFFKCNSTYLIQAKINANPKSEEIIELGKELETKLNIQINDLKKQNGDEYPALGIMYYEAISHYSSVTIIQNFIFSLISGFALGNIIFFIFISELKNMLITISLTINLFITSIFLALSDVYTAIANSEEIKFGFPEIFWNMETTCILYIIICILAIGLKKLYKTYHEIRYS